jgi:hypothetical protein
VHVRCTTPRVHPVSSVIERRERSADGQHCSHRQSEADAEPNDSWYRLEPLQQGRVRYWPMMLAVAAWAGLHQLRSYRNVTGENGFARATCVLHRCTPVAKSGRQDWEAADNVRSSSETHQVRQQTSHTLPLLILQ